MDTMFWSEFLGGCVEEPSQLACVVHFQILDQFSFSCAVSMVWYTTMASVLSKTKVCKYKCHNF